MNKTIFVILLLCGFVSLAQKEFTFPFKESGNGVPEGWKKSKPELICSVQDGTVSLAGSSTGNLFISSSSIGLEKDVTYILSCEARCKAGGDYLVYYEYQLDGKWKSHVSRSSGTGKWEQIRIRFAKQQNEINSERIILRLMNDTLLEVRGLKIKEENHNHGVTDSFPESAPIMRFIHNGSFERLEKYWNILSDATVVRSDDNLGNQALRLGEHGFVVQQSIHLLPNRKYRIILYAKTEKEEDCTLRLTLRYMPEKQLFSNDKYLLKSGPYKRFAIDFTTPDVKAPVMDVILKNEGHTPLLLTQFYLKEFSDAETSPIKIKLIEPHYRDAIFATMPCDAIRGRVEFGDDISNAMVVFRGGKANSASKTVSKDSPEFEFPAKNLEPGSYELSVSANINGKTTILAHKTIHKYPYRKNEVTISKEKYFFCDGKRYFPFMLGRTFEDPEKPVMSYLCATRGMTGRVNSGITNAEAALLALDKAHAFGLKTLLWIGSDISSSEDYETEIRKLFENVITPEVVNHPALFAYNFCDEPWAREIPAYKFEAVYRIIQELDPYHPFFINESPRGVIPEYLADYAQYSDIYGVDLYPLPAAVRHSVISDKSMAAVGKYAEIYDAATNGEKPVLMWLQGFQWLPDDSPLAVVPNAHEIKFMCMNSLLHGSKGILMFNAHMEKQFFYKDMFSVSPLVNAYETIIATGRELKAPLNAKGLLVRTFELDNDIFHLLLNEGNAEVTVDISPLGEAKPIFKDDSEIIGKTLKLRPWGFVSFSNKGTVPQASAPLAPSNSEYESLKDNFISDYYNRKFPHAISQAEWIWFPGSVKNTPKVSVDRELRFTKPITSVIINTTADNILTLRLNDKVICKSQSWDFINELDVTNLIKPNGNLLRLEAENLDGPAGLMIHIKVTYSDGTQDTICSDATWDISNGQTTSKAQSFGRFGYAPTWGWTRFTTKKHPKF